MTPRSLLAPARLAGQSVLRTQSDERLVDLAAAGSEPAFEAIVARYQRPLTAYLRRLLSRERCDDALQQTFVKAHAAIERGEQVRNLRAWLYRIAHNTAANLIRDSARPDEPLDERVAGADIPDLVADRRQTLTEVLSAVQSLPLRQRDAIVLRELEGRSYDEIAAELGVTHGAVRALLNRARTAVRSSVTALTPSDLLARVVIPVSDAPVPALSKMCAAVLVTGTAAGGGIAPPAEPAQERAARDEATRVVQAAATAPKASRVQAAVAAPAPAAPATQSQPEASQSAPREPRAEPPPPEDAYEEPDAEPDFSREPRQDADPGSWDREARNAEAPEQNAPPQSADSYGGEGFGGDGQSYGGDSAGHQHR
jgi:RNA polymerase sigma factor (sigma-70 family)